MNDIVGVFADLFKERGLFARVEDDGLTFHEHWLPAVALALNHEQAKDEGLKERGLSLGVVLLRLRIEHGRADHGLAIFCSEGNRAVDQRCVGVRDSPGGERSWQVNGFAQRKANDVVKLGADGAIVPAHDVKQLVRQQPVELGLIVPQDFCWKDNRRAPCVSRICLLIPGGANQPNHRRQRQPQIGEPLLQSLERLGNRVDFRFLPRADMLLGKLLPVGERDLLVSLEPALQVKAAEAGGE